MKNASLEKTTEYSFAAILRRTDYSKFQTKLVYESGVEGGAKRISLSSWAKEKVSAIIADIRLLLATNTTVDIRQNGLCKLVFLFLFGGGVYNIIEMLWRGFTHISMFFTGALCFLALIFIYHRKIPFFLKCLLGGVTITLLEFAAGCVVNLWLGLGVWDYSSMPLNILGQVCLLYLILWCVLSPIVYIIYARLLRWFHCPVCLRLKKPAGLFPAQLKREG